MKNSMTLIWHLQLLLLRLPLFFGLWIAFSKQINQSGDTFRDVAQVAFFRWQRSRAAFLASARENSGIGKEVWDESCLRSVVTCLNFQIGALSLQVWQGYDGGIPPNTTCALAECVGSRMLTSECFNLTAQRQNVVFFTAPFLGGIQDYETLC